MGHPVIALDIMGGDDAPDVPLQAAQQALKQNPELRLKLVGPDALIRDKLAPDFLSAPEAQRMQIVSAEEVIAMHEAPVRAVRRKIRSSLVLGIQELVQAEAEAFVTAGNSGAAVVAASQALKRLPGILRPAMAVLFPGQSGDTVLVDVGAQSQCQPEHLLQFARLGALLAHAVLGIERPRVGLLNIGEEASKGHQLAKNAHALLSASHLHFLGNIEGWDLPRNRVDVAVCDGFTGNVVLKLAEGLGEFFTELCPSLQNSPGFERFNYTEHGGSLLLGLEKLVIITHGRSSVAALVKAIELAYRTLGSRILAQMQAEFENEV